MYFSIHSQYNGPELRTEKQFSQPRVKTTFKGPESLKFFVPKIWNIVPAEYKSVSSLQKWIERIHKASLPLDSESTNSWYDQNEYNPKEGEAGCLYKIIETTTKSIVEIWCGC